MKLVTASEVFGRRKAVESEMLLRRKERSEKSGAKMMDTSSKGGESEDEGEVEGTRLTNVDWTEKCQE